MSRPDRPRGRAPLAVLSILFLVSATTYRAQEPPPSPGPPGGAVAVHVAGLRQAGNEQVLLILADEGERRFVPIAVGRDQGIAIYLGKTKTETPRPMTHDLLADILKVLGAVVDRITVTSLKADTYFAEIALRAGGKVHPIDARPSDAIALAVRMDAPMFSAASLLKPLDGAAHDPAIHAEKRLGLTVQELDGDLAASLGAEAVRGVLVASVLKGGVAERAGLRRGDILQALDGVPVPHLAEFKGGGGREVRSFTIWRDGETKTIATP